MSKFLCGLKSQCNTQRLCHTLAELAHHDVHAQHHRVTKHQIKHHWHIQPNTRMQKLENEQPAFDGIASDLLMVLAVATYELPDSRGRYPVLEDEVED